MKITIDSIDFEVIIQRKRIKNIYFRIKDDLKIYVSCNMLCTNNYIEKLLISNSKDIIKMYNNMNKKSVNDTEIYYLGTLMKIEYSTNIKIEDSYIYGPSKEQINDYLEHISINIFQERLNKLKILFNTLPEFRLRTRKMKTRWGVCNKSSMTVTLNTELIHKDVTLIDYVIIHELCHFKYMNHSDKFWKEVEKYYPYHKLARKRLR